MLQKEKGVVRSVDVARHMDVSKPSVCHAVATLRDGGFLTMDEDYFLHLTDAGREVAEQIYEKHRFILIFLTILKIPITGHLLLYFIIQSFSFTFTTASRFNENQPVQSF